MSETITIMIETGNSAFADSPTGEIARILRELADSFVEDGGPIRETIHDINGNLCGSVRVAQK